MSTQQVAVTIHDLRERSFAGYPFDPTAAMAEGLDGAIATLDGFYDGLNRRNLATLDAVWAEADLCQLNNPVGGILRGPDAIHRLYEAVVTGPVQVRVVFTDVVAYEVPGMITFAGRELGHYTVDGSVVDLEIRTTRVMGYLTGMGWRQMHHHGSIDRPTDLAAYQHSIQSSGIPSTRP